MRRDDERTAGNERDWAERRPSGGRDFEPRETMFDREDDYGYMGRRDWGDQAGYQGSRDFDRDRQRSRYEGSHARGYGDRGGYGRGTVGNYEPTQWGGQWDGPQMSDVEIRRRVYNALDRNPRIPLNAELHVEVKDCEVTMTGMVRTREAKMAAWDCAWSVPSVEDVHNNIRVQSRYRQGITMQQQGGENGSTPDNMA